MLLDLYISLLASEAMVGFFHVQTSFYFRERRVLALYLLHDYPMVRSTAVRVRVD